MEPNPTSDGSRARRSFWFSAKSSRRFLRRFGCSATRALRGEARSESTACLVVGGEALRRAASMELSRSITLISRSAQCFWARQDALCAVEYLGKHGAVSRNARLAVFQHAASTQLSQSLTRIFCARRSFGWQSKTHSAQSLVDLHLKHLLFSIACYPLRNVRALARVKPMPCALGAETRSVFLGRLQDLSRRSRGALVVAA